MAKKKGKRVTTKRVQATENLPPKTPKIDHKPEVDEDVPESDGLTIRQRLFVEAITGPAIGNATKAAEMAGYKADNYFTLAATASENLKKPYIQEAIAHALARRRMSPEWAKAGLVDIASSSFADFLTLGDDGQPRLDFAKAAAMGAIGHIREYREEGVDARDGTGPVIIKRTIKLHDRTKALELLLRLHGLLNDKLPEADEPPAFRMRPVNRVTNPDATPGSN